MPLLCSKGTQTCDKFSGMTAKQEAAIRAIAAQEDHAYFVTTRDGFDFDSPRSVKREGARKPGPFMLTWFDTKDQLHMVRLYQNGTHGEHHVNPGRYVDGKWVSRQPA